MKKIKNESGFTMVELIVTFALLSLFITAAMIVISSATNIYYRGKAISAGMNVSNMLMEKITGQLESALIDPISDDELRLESGGVPSNTAIQITKLESDKNNKIKFTDRTGSLVSILEKNGKLVIHYYQVDTLDDETGLPKKMYDDVDWKFDESVYMGYSLSKLTFQQANHNYIPGTIRVDITLHHPVYGDYSCTEYVNCYNFYGDKTDYSSRIVDNLISK